MKRIRFILVVGLLIFGNSVFCQKTKIIKKDTTTSAKIVEVMPEFPGGYEALIRFSKEHLKYPEKAKSTGIQGTIIVQFVVKKNGKVAHPKILKGIGSGCDKEVIRMVKSMPRWKPGMQNGKEVAVLYKMPIKLTLR